LTWTGERTQGPEVHGHIVKRHHRPNARVRAGRATTGIALLLRDTRARTRGELPCRGVPVRVDL